MHAELPSSHHLQIPVAVLAVARRRPRSSKVCRCTTGCRRRQARTVSGGGGRCLGHGHYRGVRRWKPPPAGPRQQDPRRRAGQLPGLLGAAVVGDRRRRQGQRLRRRRARPR